MLPDIASSISESVGCRLLATRAEAEMMRPVSQLWQTPVRHDHRTGTSHASASSRRFWNTGAQRTLRPLRAKDTSGPVPTGSAGGCGGLSGAAAIPGVRDGPAPDV